MVTELEPGMLVGRYRLLRRIAEGGMGSVWAARDERLDRDVAIKLLPRLLVTDPSAERRFEREARAMGRLQHPNVVTVFDVGQADPGSGEELPFLVMELLTGESLDRIMASGPLDPERAVAIFRQVAAALAGAHAAGVVHRDLKPSNVMVTPTGHVKVLDFGLARLQQQDGQTPEDTLTTPGMVLGSCPYMAPEQALGQQVGPASDAFSLGAVMYEALSGQRAFDGSTPMRVLQAVVKCEFTPLEMVAPNVPPSLAEVVRRCLERDPEDRYSGGAELEETLTRLASSEELRGSQPHPILDEADTVENSPLPRRSLPALPVAVAAAALLLGAVLGYLLRSGSAPAAVEPGRWTVRELLSVEGELLDPGWNPAGTELVVAEDAGDRTRVLAIPVIGGTVRLLLQGTDDEELAWPRVSPDGRMLAVTASRGITRTVRLVSLLDGSQRTELLDAAHASWIGAERLVFARLRGGTSSLWEYSISTGIEQVLLEGSEEFPWWFAVPRSEGGLAVVGGPTSSHGGVFVLSSVGGDPHQWLAPGRSMTGVDWAPGGRSLVATVANGIVRITRSTSQPLLPALEVLRDPAFSPSGEQLAVVRVHSGSQLLLFEGINPDAW